MSEEEARLHYEAAEERLELLQVLVGIDDIVDTYKKAAAEMRKAGDYQDARELADKYEAQAKQAEADGKEKQYQLALEKIKNNTSDDVLYILARESLLQISDYKDAEEQIKECNRMIQKIGDSNRKKQVAKTILLVILVAGILLGLITHERKLYKESQETAEYTTEQEGEKE